MHREVKEFCKWVKKIHPKPFRGNILDVGSLDVNGTNRYLRSWGSTYIGLDITAGKNVDVVMPITKYISYPSRNVVISTEMLEHDKEWQESLMAMYNLLIDGGLLIVTCAAPGRPEHGTYRTEPESSPATNDYYCNISIEDFYSVLSPSMFKEYFIRQKGTDLQFYGIKKPTVKT